MNSLAATCALLIGLAAVSPAALSAPAAVSAPAWGIVGTHAVGAHPTDLAFDAAGHAWVANFGDGTVSKLSPAGAVLGTYAAGGKPRKVAVDAAGQVWVANWGANTVTRLSPEGRLLGRYAVGELPNSLAIDGAGHVWVGNMGSHTVMRLSPVGEVEGRFSIERPSSLAVAPNGRVWVTSLTAAKYNLVELTADCMPVAFFMLPPMPERVAVDGGGNVWVSHMVGPAARKVSRLSADGKRLSALWTGFKNQAVAVDGEGNGWIANTEYVIDGVNGYLASNPLTNTVTRLSPGGRLLGTYSAGADAWAVKVAPWGEAWVLNHLGGSITRLRPQAAPTAP